MLRLEQRWNWLGLRVLGGPRVRRMHFHRDQNPILVELDGTLFPINIDKKSFWIGNCGELIGVALRDWIIKNGLATGDRVGLEVVEPYHAFKAVPMQAALPAKGDRVMKSSLFVAVVTAFFAAAAPALAEKTGNDVLDSCQTAVRHFDNNGAPAGQFFDGGWCSGWVTGALQLTKLHNDWTTFVKQKPTLLQFCVPDPGIPVIQAMRVVVKYLKDHPEQLHEDGMGLTVAALKDSFPCK